MRFAPAHEGDRAGIAVVQDTAYFYALSLARTAAGTAIVDGPRRGGGLLWCTTTVGCGSCCAAHVVAKDLDATMLSTKHAGGFIGATVGPFARAGG